MTRAWGSAFAHAFVFGRSESLRLRRMFRRAAARNSVGRARTQVDVNVVEVAHHVLVVGKGRHDLLLAGAEIPSAADDDAVEFGVPDRFERIREGRGVARSFPVGAVTPQALGGISAKA